MIDIDIDADVAQLERALRGLEKQIPFATAYALTLTAQDVQRHVIEELPRDFTIRTGWTEKGIRIKPARKNNLVATVGSIDRNMEMQVKGKVTTEEDQPVPVGARKSPQSVTRKSQWPGKMLSKGRGRRKPFKATVGGLTGVWRRKGKARFPLELLWNFAQRATTKGRWDFGKLAENKSRERLPKNLRKAVRKIIRELR